MGTLYQGSVSLLGGGTNSEEVLADAKAYTDEQIASIPTPDVSGQISSHDADATAHSDIRAAVNDALTEAKGYTDTEVAALVGAAPEALNTIEELSTAMQNNPNVVSALEAAIANKAEATALTAHTSNTSNPHGVTATQIGAMTAVFSIGTSAPSDTKLLWIDTTANTGGLKYYNGSAWAHVPVAYT